MLCPARAVLQQPAASGSVEYDIRELSAIARPPFRILAQHQLKQWAVGQLLCSRGLARIYVSNIVQKALD